MMNAEKKQPIKDFEQLLSSVQSRVKSGDKPRAALVPPHESEMIPAFKKAIDLDLIEPYIVGDERLFRKNAASYTVNPDKVRFIDINQPEMAVVTAGQMAARSELDLICKGRMSAEAVLRLLFDKKTGFVQKKKRVTHLTVMKPERYPKLLSLADAAVAVSHEIPELIGTIQTSSGFLERLNIERPRTAILAAVEVVYPQMASTIKGAVLSVMARRKQIKEARIDGPLSFDVAIDSEAAQGKGIVDSEVAGQADLLIATDLTTANGIYKAMTLYGDVSMGGIVIGGAAPLTLSAYSDSEATRFNSILLGIAASV